MFICGVFCKSAAYSSEQPRNVTKRNSCPAVLHVRKLKGESGTNLPSLSQARLKELIEEAIVDAYGEEEQAGGFFTMIEEHLALPFSVKVLGVDADVEKVGMTLDGQIVATCRRGKTRQKIPILDLVLDTGIGKTISYFP
jgi:Calcium binding